MLSLSVKAETWLQYGNNIECPDALELRNESYSIFNDCYGFEPKEPIIETGKIEIDGEYISFLYRKVQQRSFLQGDAKSQKLKILVKTSNELHLQDGSRIFRFKIINVPN